MLSAQNIPEYSVEATYFRGAFLRHSTEIAHLIDQTPQGALLKFNKQTTGQRDWQISQNYPAMGFSVLYQNTGNAALGNHIAVYAHYQWFFVHRMLSFTLGQGIGWATNPYDSHTNYLNTAYGSHLLSATYLQLSLRKERLIGDWGMHFDLGLYHFSNGSLRTPNTSTNTIAASAGINYSIGQAEDFNTEFGREDSLVRKNRVQTIVRSGLHEIDVIGMGLTPFLHLGAGYERQYARHASWEVGTDLFLTFALRKWIEHKAVSIPEGEYTGQEDFKRIGVYVGHNYSLHKNAMHLQFGYYLYNPVDRNQLFYQRIGLSRAIDPKGDWRLGVGLKTHAAKAEAVEFSIQKKW
ncbi:MAG: acyloxyacyl hydrolase [Weeksellaceae bacterium]|nr:acyloxyacyl hydrolase [Weeksellaceae bacterium]